MGRVRPSAFGITALLAALCICTCACLALLALRLEMTDSREYIFLRWNLALAWLPMGFALLTFWEYRSGAPGVLCVLSGLLWLLFLPNGPYLVTDVVHLGNTWASAPMWFDLVMFSVFGGTGLFLGYASLYLVHGVLAERYGATAGWGAICAVFALSSVGIYFGRILRLNSWDAITRPELLVSIVHSRLADPFGNPALFPLLGSMTVMLAVGYAIFVRSTRVAGQYVPRPNRTMAGR